MRRTLLLCACALAMLVAACSKDYTIELVNRAGFTLVPYPVVTDPPPPHREQDPTIRVADGQRTQVDPTGFNPLYLDEASKRGLMMQFALDDEPAQILVRIYQYQVPPGQEGTDPGLAPVLLREELFEPTKFTLEFTVGPPDQEFPLVFAES